MAEPVDTEVAVDAVGVFAVLVCVDAGGEDELQSHKSDVCSSVLAITLPV